MIFCFFREQNMSRFVLRYQVIGFYCHIAILSILMTKNTIHKQITLTIFNHQFNNSSHKTMASHKTQPPSAKKNEPPTHSHPSSSIPPNMLREGKDLYLGRDNWSFNPSSLKARGVGRPDRERQRKREVHTAKEKGRD